MLTRLAERLRDSPTIKTAAALRTLLWVFGLPLVMGGALYGWFHQDVDDFINDHTLAAYRLAMVGFGLALLGFILAMLRMQHHRRRAVDAEAALANLRETPKAPRKPLRAKAPMSIYVRPTAHDSELWNWFREYMNPEGALIQRLRSEVFTTFRWGTFKILEDFLDNDTPKWEFQDQRLEKHRLDMRKQAKALMEGLVNATDLVDADKETFRFKNHREWGSSDAERTARDALVHSAMLLVAANHELFRQARDLKLPL